MADDSGVGCSDGTLVPIEDAEVCDAFLVNLSHRSSSSLIRMSNLRSTSAHEGRWCGSWCQHFLMRRASPLGVSGAIQGRSPFTAT